jgi:hypothetical protein
MNIESYNMTTLLACWFRDVIALFKENQANLFGLPEIAGREKDGC